MPSILQRVANRQKQVRQYMKLASGPGDWISFFALGVARGHPFGGNDMVSRVGRRFFSQIVARPRNLHGLSIMLDPADVTHMVIFDELFLENNYDLDLVPFQPDQIFDCGGHIGMFTVLASSRFKECPLTVFEPNPKNAAWIRRQIAGNSLKAELIEGAVSTYDGSAVFEDRVSFSGHLADGTQPGQSAGQYTVKVVNLLEILRQRNPQRLLLKLDVEGEETKILPVLMDLLPRTSAVFFETHDGDKGFETAKALFEATGFKVERRRAWDFCIDGFALRQ